MDSPRDPNRFLVGMLTAFIPYIVALVVFFCVLMILRLLVKAGLPWWHQVMRDKRYWLWFNAVPVSPLTKILTRETHIVRLAEQAHMRNTFSLPRVLRYKELSLWVSFIIVVVLVPTTPLDQVVLVAVLLCSLSWRWPELFLARQALRVQRSLEKDLTSVLDLLRLYVSAGRNLEDAVRSVAGLIGGGWHTILGSVVYRLDSGVPFEAALEHGAGLAAAPDFDRFLLALKQSRLLGASLSGTLTAQATFLRSRRRQRAEEQARSAAVKITLPLVLCIFPALLIIYLAPAVLRVLQGF